VKKVDPTMAKIVRKGLIIVYTGEGKGKTTAALGLAFRASGYGMKVLMVQFLKGAWHYGELDAAKMIKNIEIIPMGEGFTWVMHDREREAKKAKEAWQFAREKIASSQYGMIILDEINYALSYGYLDVDEVAEFIAKKPPKLHLVLTGRNAPQKIVDLADLVTEMREIKHPYRKGVTGQKGIEY